MFVGIDDTDSLHGMCTTYLASKIIKRFSIKSTPRLIRLNPNIPFKTRGNGAVEIRVHKKHMQDVIDLVCDSAHICHGANPGVVFCEDREQAKNLRQLYRMAVCRKVPISMAKKTIRGLGLDYFSLGNGRGLIGAASAIGADLTPKTYELLAYRSTGASGKRKFNPDDAARADRKLYPLVFDSIGSKGQPLIYPRGKDPVYCGIRGVSKDAVCDAWALLSPKEPIEFTQVFVTNQATDAHYRSKPISHARRYDCLKITGVVCGMPERVAGGHSILQLSDGSQSINCAAYRQTGSLRDVVDRLVAGDEVAVFGGISDYERTLNIEKIEVRRLAEKTKHVVPNCCGRAMTSAGKNKGFKCRKCSKRSGGKEVMAVRPEKGFYEAAAESRRHLARPLALADL